MPPRFYRLCSVNAALQRIEASAAVVFVSKSSLLGGRLTACGRLSDHYGQRKTQLHDVVHEQFHEINSNGFEFDLTEDGNIRGVMGGILEGKLDLALANERRLIGGHDPHIFGKGAYTRGPSIKHAKLYRRDRDLRHAHVSDDTDQDKISINLLPDVFAEKRAL
jgi:hypothetical protein